jgi:hypothetical protein
LTYRVLVLCRRVFQANPERHLPQVSTSPQGGMKLGGANVESMRRPRKGDLFGPGVEKSFVVMYYRDRTANRHRWMGRESQGGRGNVRSGTRQYNGRTLGIRPARCMLGNGKNSKVLNFGESASSFQKWGLLVLFQAKTWHKIGFH